MRGKTFLFILGFLLFVNISLISAYHPASELEINIDGTLRTLEYAANNNLLRGTTHTYAAPSLASIPNPGHPAGEIWISTDSGEMTLLSALSNRVLLKKTSFTGYTNTLALGHVATDVWLSSPGKTLQQAINDGDFACISHSSSSCYNGNSYWYNSCGEREEIRQDCSSSLPGSVCVGGVCTCTSHASLACYNEDVYWYNSCGVREERSRDCTSPTSHCVSGTCCVSDVGLVCPRNMADRVCYSTLGIMSCSGTCTGTVPYPLGTYCRQVITYNPYRVTNYYCDGAGSCSCTPTSCPDTTCGATKYNNCGVACGTGTICGTGQTCSPGGTCVCASTGCPSSGSAVCGTPLYDNCGTRCGTGDLCGSDERCESGSCVYTCNPTGCPDGPCGTPLYDNCGNYCGTGTSCGGGDECAGGSCVPADDGGDDDDDGGKIICAELYRQGLMDEEIYRADEEFGADMKEAHPNIMAGYTLFARPIVSLMQKSEGFTKAVNFIAKPWSEEMAYKEGARESGNFAGAIIMNVGMLFFGLVGSIMLGQISMAFIAGVATITILLAVFILRRKK